MTLESSDSIDVKHARNEEGESSKETDVQTDVSTVDSKAPGRQDADRKASLLDAMLQGERVEIEWDGEEVAEGAFAYRVNVDRVVLPNAKSVGESAFLGCVHLYFVELPAVEKIGQFAFAETGSLKMVILGNKEQVVSLGDDAFLQSCHANGEEDPYFNASGEKDCYIYVPDNLVEAYKASDDWADFAEQIKPFSEINY